MSQTYRMETIQDIIRAGLALLVQSTLLKLHNRVILKADPPSLAAGYAVLISTLLFFLLGSYATLFSAFWPLTGFWVRFLYSAHSGGFSLIGDIGLRCVGSGHALQVFCSPVDPYYSVFRDRELGRMAILQKFLILLWS